MKEGASSGASCAIGMSRSVRLPHRLSVLTRSTRATGCHESSPTKRSQYQLMLAPQATVPAKTPPSRPSSLPLSAAPEPSTDATGTSTPTPAPSCSTCTRCHAHAELPELCAVRCAHAVGVYTPQVTRQACHAAAPSCVVAGAGGARTGSGRARAAAAAVAAAAAATRWAASRRASYTVLGGAGRAGCAEPVRPRDVTCELARRAPRRRSHALPSGPREHIASIAAPSAMRPCPH